MDNGSSTLSEFASKQLIASYGIPVSRERLADDAAAAVQAATEVGLPVVLKLCGDGIAHKTERDLVRLGLGSVEAVREAAEDLLGRRRPEDGEVALLVAEMVEGRRELIAGLVRDPQFGPCVVLGLGGILTEALGDVVFAAAPLSRQEAGEMIRRLAASHLITRPFRGEPAADEEALVDILVGLGRLGVERAEVASVDLNPVILRGAQPVAVDALVEIGEAQAELRSAPKPRSDEEAIERFRPLFDPRGIVVAGVSSHPGKFGFTAYHNLLRFGYRGELFPVNRDGVEILGRPTLRDVSEVPEGRADLVFVCTPNQVNIELLRACAERGVRAAFIASGGYGEAGEKGKILERELVEVADQLGMLVAGPNGQGVISTGCSMCAQIVAPNPPPGHVAVVSQSGNLVSSFLNYAVLSGVGVSKAISSGNSAQTELADFIEYFGADPETRVALAYLEGVSDGGRFIEAARVVTARKPLVIVKGGVASEGKRAAASHTGAMASDDRVFDGIARQLGVLRAPSVEHAFEWAASFATQPLPRGRRTVVFTTAGGWGVLAADACVAAGLELIPLPKDLMAQIDGMVPPRWSRNNPVDLAGGETRDTVPEALDLIAAHPEVDAVIHLGLGIQAAQANAFRSGGFHPDYGLDRIVEFHQRQDRRYATAAREASERHGKPVLSATELVYADRDYGNAGPVCVRKGGRLCYPSAHRAVAALRAMVDYAEFRASLDRRVDG
jgi:acetyltransferase